MALTKRESEALDNAKRVLELAEKSAGSGVADRLIQIADRWLQLADRSR